MAVTIDLERLTIADYPALVKLVERILTNPLDLETNQELVAMLDRVVEGGTASVPVTQFNEVRRAFLVAVAEMLNPKRSGALSGTASGSSGAPRPSHTSSSPSLAKPTEGTGSSSGGSPSR